MEDVLGVYARPYDPGRLAQRVPGLLPTGQTVWLDVDDTIKPVYGRSKQGAEHGYTRVRG